jgi:hypothetical protein
VAKTLQFGPLTVCLRLRYAAGDATVVPVAFKYGLVECQVQYPWPPKGMHTEARVLRSFYIEVVK